MQSFSTKALASILAIIGVTNAHMIMSSPIPFGRSTLNNSPLDAAGADFPCKMRGASTFDPEGAENILIKGQPNTLSFIGSAVHGGGSCQVSLTTDLQPSKSSKWMVIKSIEGGCPANVDGNLPADPTGTGAATFQYTVPDEIADGNYVIAWTWFNKIGNREMYMNCGPATVQSAAKKRYAPAPPVSKRQTSSLPDIMVANIGNGCSTPDSQIIKFPNPGNDVQVLPGASLVAPVGSCGTAAAVVAGTSSSSNDFSSAASATKAASSATQAASSAAAVSPGNFATGAASQSTKAAASATAVVSPLQSSAAAASPPAATGSTTTPTTAVGSQSGACTPEGAWACSADGTSFQRCASGTWSAAMAMAAGTSCVPGISQSLSMTTAGSSAKRDLRSHLNRRHHLGSLFSS